MVVEIIYAGMVESVDTRDLKSLGSDIVRVQFPFPAPKINIKVQRLSNVITHYRDKIYSE